MDPRLLHVTTCASGMARQRRHRAVQRVLGQELAAAGGFVDYERYIGSLSNGSTPDARMDVTCWFPGAGAWHLLDVTVRAPHAAHVGDAADHVAGRAGEIGEGDKERRYGEAVEPIAMEYFGRMPEYSAAVLAQLASEAAGSSQVAPARVLVGRWLQRLERELMFAVADCAQLALEGGREAQQGPAPPRARP